LLERDGERGLTMRRLADSLGIRAPSLYKHLPDKHALEMELVATGFAMLADALESAASPGQADGLAAMAAAYRRFALSHPHLYRLTNDRPLRRDLLPVGVEDRAAAALVAAVHGDEQRARAAWAFAHGMVMLELNGRFPAGADLDAAWAAGVAAFTAPA
jgi:AcrR family transcriptional regulator